MPLGWYYSDPGSKFNSGGRAVRARRQGSGRELLFPVYRGTRGSGSNFEYEVIGWVGFHLTGFDDRRQVGKLYGSFTRIIWDGIQSESSTGTTSALASISLVD